MTKQLKTLSVLVAFLFVFVLFTANQLQADETVKCPVSGKEIKKSDAKGTYEYDGKTYYFCCENCKEAFVKEPEKYISGKSHEGDKHEGHVCGEYMAEDTAVDPVCGMKVKKSDAAATYEYNNKTYYFCMEECKEKFVKNPEKYLMADEEMVACIVTGEKVKKSEALTYKYKEKTYYFCCAGCKDKFIKDPEKYIEKFCKKDVGPVF